MGIDGDAFLGDVSPTRFNDSVVEMLKSLCGITIDDGMVKSRIKISPHCIKVYPSEIVLVFSMAFLLVLFEVKIGLLDDHQFCH